MSITSDMIKSNGFIHALADDAANEIEELEKAYKLLYANNSKNYKRITELKAEVARLKAAIPSLYPVIKWLENGCNTSDAIAELKIYQSRIDEAIKGGA